MNVGAQWYDTSNIKLNLGENAIKETHLLYRRYRRCTNAILLIVLLVL